MKANPFSRFDRIWSRWKQLEVTVEHRCWFEEAGRREYHPALDLGNVDALQVESGSLARSGFHGRMTVHLNATNSHRSLGWKDFDFLFFLNTACDQRSRNNGSKSLHC